MRDHARIFSWLKYKICTAHSSKITNTTQRTAGLSTALRHHHKPSTLLQSTDLMLVDSRISSLRETSPLQCCATQSPQSTSPSPMTRQHLSSLTKTEKDWRVTNYYETIRGQISNVYCDAINLRTRRNLWSSKSNCRCTYLSHSQMAIKRPTSNSGPFTFREVDSLNGKDSYGVFLPCILHTTGDCINNCNLWSQKVF